MLKQIPIWFKNLTPGKQFGVSFSANWIIWFLSSLLADKVFDLQQSLGSHIFSATFMACFAAIFFNWNNTKALFKRIMGNHSTKSTDN